MYLYVTFSLDIPVTAGVKSVSFNYFILSDKCKPVDQQFTLHILSGTSPSLCGEGNP